MGCSRSVWAKRKPSSLQGYLNRALKEDPFSTPNTNQPPAPPLCHHHPPTQSNLLWQRVAPRRSSPLLLFDSLGRPHTYRPSGFSLYTLTNGRIYIWLLIYFITFHHYWTLGERLRVSRLARKCPAAKTRPFFPMFYSPDVWAAAIWSPKRNKVWMGDAVAQG